MMTPEDAATIAGTCVRTVFRLIEAGTIHYVETPAGTVHVCVVSLLNLPDAMAWRTVSIPTRRDNG
jgi:predicted site-specific integrase-resolvase